MEMLRYSKLNENRFRLYLAEMEKLEKTVKAAKSVLQIMLINKLNAENKDQERALQMFTNSSVNKFIAKELKHLDKAAADVEKSIPKIGAELQAALS